MMIALCAWRLQGWYGASSWTVGLESLLSGSGATVEVPPPVCDSVSHAWTDGRFVTCLNRQLTKPDGRQSGVGPTRPHMRATSKYACARSAHANDGRTSCGTECVSGARDGQDWMCGGLVIWHAIELEENLWHAVHCGTVLPRGLAKGIL